MDIDAALKPLHDACPDYEAVETADLTALENRLRTEADIVSGVLRRREYPANYTPTLRPK